MAPHRGQLRSFAYLNAEKAELYRAVMASFTAAKARFSLHLRPRDLERSLAEELASGDELEAALQQLCEWGNLEAHPDTAEVATVEEFYRARHLYQMTPAGEAAERAVAFYEATLHEGGALQTAALEDIQTLLGELLQLAKQEQPDAAKTHRTLASLCNRFEGLTARAQTFIASLQRTIDLRGIEVEALLEYKEALIDYLERFIGELALTTPEIAASLREIERADCSRAAGNAQATTPASLLELAAERDLADQLAPGEADLAAARESWHARWLGLRAWFLDRPEAPSQSAVLRARARSAIPALLAAVASVHDRRVSRSDRTSDLKTLARWFAETDSDADAHRLWRAAFALTPARHLSIDAATLDAREAKPVPARTSWLDAPPLEISPRLRTTGRQRRTGQTRRLIDRSQEKALLAEAAAEEERQIAAAQQRLATGQRMRLSEVARLDPMEFDLFLDLLGEALALRIDPSQPVEASSQDGVLRIVLEPTGDTIRAEIETRHGIFQGPDHFITIERRQPDDLEWEAQDWTGTLEVQASQP